MQRPPPREPRPFAIMRPPEDAKAELRQPLINDDDAYAQRRQSKRWTRTVPLWIGALSALVVALLLVAAALAGVSVGVEWGPRIAKRARSLEAFVDRVQPPLEEQLVALAGGARSLRQDIFTDAAVEAARVLARRASAALASLSDASLDGSRQDAIDVAERARLWERRFDTLWQDRRVAILARGVDDMSRLLEQRGDAFFDDADEVLRRSHDFVKQLKRRLATLELVLAHNGPDAVNES